MRINAIRICTTFVGCALAWTSASAQIRTCPATYVYTGEVFQGPGNFGNSVPTGSLVTGTYVFEAENATRMSGNRGSALDTRHVGSELLPWSVGNSASNGDNIPTGYAFSSTAQVHGISYSSNSPDPQAAALESGYFNGYLKQERRDFSASELQTDSFGRSTASSLRIQAGDSTAAFGPHGLPRLDGSVSATGQFAMNGWSLSFRITSLTLVSAPPERCIP